MLTLLIATICIIINLSRICLGAENFFYIIIFMISPNKSKHCQNNSLNILAINLGGHVHG